MWPVSAKRMASLAVPEREPRHEERPAEVGLELQVQAGQVVVRSEQVHAPLGQRSLAEDVALPVCKSQLQVGAGLAAARGLVRLLVLGEHARRQREPAREGAGADETRSMSRSWLSGQETEERALPVIGVAGRDTGSG